MVGVFVFMTLIGFNSAAHSALYPQSDDFFVVYSIPSRCFTLTKESIKVDKYNFKMHPSIEGFVVLKAEATNLLKG